MVIRNNASLMRELIEKMGYMARVMDADRRVIYINEKMRKEFGDILGQHCYKLFGMTEKCDHCVTSECQEKGEADKKDVLIGERYYNVMSSPVNTKQGEQYSIELLHEVTEQKKIETELLNHYQKLKEDMEFAKRIQRNTLPVNGEYGDALRIDSCYLPSEDLGGDIFDVVKIDENKMLLYIADVSGHGVKSSLLTIFLRQLIRGRTYESSNIGLHGLLDIILKSYNDLGSHEEQYLSVLFCCYDKVKKELSFLNAGHNCLPVVISKKGYMTEVVVRGMPVCNLIDQPNHQIVSIKANKGDRVLLLTDGITEAYNRKKGLPFGSAGVAEVIRAHGQLPGSELTKKIVAAVEAYTDESLIDDAAVVMAEIL